MASSTCLQGAARSSFLPLLPCPSPCPPECSWPLSWLARVQWERLVVTYTCPTLPRPAPPRPAPPPLARSPTEVAISSITIMSWEVPGTTADPWYSMMLGLRQVLSIEISFCISPMSSSLRWRSAERRAVSARGRWSWTAARPLARAPATGHKTALLCPSCRSSARAGTHISSRSMTFRATSRLDRVSYLRARRAGAQGGAAAALPRNPPLRLLLAAQRACASSAGRRLCPGAAFLQHAPPPSAGCAHTPGPLPSAPHTPDQVALARAARGAGGGQEPGKQNSSPSVDVAETAPPQQLDLLVALPRAAAPLLRHS